MRILVNAGHFSFYMINNLSFAGQPLNNSNLDIAKHVLKTNYKEINQNFVAGLPWPKEILLDMSRKLCIEIGCLFSPWRGQTNHNNANQNKTSLEMIYKYIHARLNDVFQGILRMRED